MKGILEIIDTNNFTREEIDLSELKESLSIGFTEKKSHSGSPTVLTPHDKDWRFILEYNPQKERFHFRYPNLQEVDAGKAPRFSWQRGTGNGQIDNADPVGITKEMDLRNYIYSFTPKGYRPMMVRLISDK